MWANTGGSAITGESSRQAIRRELFEETGIAAEEAEFEFLGTKVGGGRISDTYLLQREARGGERAAAQVGEQIFRQLVRAIHSQADGGTGICHGDRLAEGVLHALRGEIVPVKPDGGDAGTGFVPGLCAFEQDEDTVDIVFPQHTDEFGDADERCVAVEDDDLRLGDDGQPQRQRGVVLRAEVLGQSAGSQSRCGCGRSGCVR